MLTDTVVSGLAYPRVPNPTTLPIDTLPRTTSLEYDFQFSTVSNNLNSLHSTKYLSTLLLTLPLNLYRTHYHQGYLLLPTVCYFISVPLPSCGTYYFPIIPSTVIPHYPTKPTALHGTLYFLLLAVPTASPFHILYCSTVPTTLCSTFFSLTVPSSPLLPSILQYPLAPNSTHYSVDYPLLSTVPTTSHSILYLASVSMLFPYPPYPLFYTTQCRPIFRFSLFIFFSSSRLYLYLADSSWTLVTSLGIASWRALRLFFLLFSRFWIPFRPCSIVVVFVNFCSSFADAAVAVAVVCCLLFPFVPFYERFTFF